MKYGKRLHRRQTQGASCAGMTRGSPSSITVFVLWNVQRRPRTAGWKPGPSLQSTPACLSVYLPTYPPVSHKRQVPCTFLCSPFHLQAEVAATSLLHGGLGAFQASSVSAGYWNSTRLKCTPSPFVVCSQTDS